MGTRGWPARGVLALGLLAARAGAPAAPTAHDALAECARGVGHVLIHCARSGALGNYLLTLPAALLFAIVLGRALVLECDEPAFDLGRRVELSAQLRRYLRGAHFDWTLPPRARAALNVDAARLWGADAPPPGAPPRCNGSGEAALAGWDSPSDAARAAAARRLAATAGPVRLYISMADGAGPLLDRSGAVRAALARRIGALAERTAPAAQLVGCLLRYLLAPTPALARLQRAVVPPADGADDGAGADDGGGSGGGGGALLHAATLHTRLGDSVWFEHAGARAGWRWTSEANAELRALHAAPERAVRCLALASDNDGGGNDGGGNDGGGNDGGGNDGGGNDGGGDGGGGGGGGDGGGALAAAGRAPPAAGRCLAPVVLSDSARMAACARALWPAVRLTPGVATHPLVSNASMLLDQSNRDKVFADWWMLARSRGLLSLGRPVSSFFATARAFRDATSAAGWWLTIPPDLERLADRSCVRRAAPTLGAESASRLLLYGVEALWAPPTLYVPPRRPRRRARAPSRCP
ncbi:hypothetical protein KFE25_012628 [Diacronema lutheri]|uniref:Uncharacterized protein n=1 Tax=Diacronema lutheri TaxID=2081491 RepID=A0A8J5X6H8_DIALT|nr:hypothetical protein KFE25_012628 [Diacronema lutheri]